MTAQPLPVSRQPACPSCPAHEWHLTACEWCICPGSSPIGVYLDPWPAYCGSDDGPPD